MKIFEKFAEIQSWLTLRGVDSAQANTAQSFAETNFFFAGLSLPWKRIKYIFLYMWTI